ncbi:MAG: type II CRISPR-associated endonuclease Cas1 [Monoglobaceae bacterium]
MPENGWRTVILDSKSELSCSDGNLIIKGDAVKTVPLSEVRMIFVNSAATTLTVNLINEINKYNVKLVFCDERHNPSCELTGYSGHTEAAGRLMDQAGWKEKKKAEVWKDIVCQKISNQCRLLEYLTIEYPEVLREYLYNIKENDVTNREGQAARIYFNRLFGMTFVRHSDDKINSGLNYGYTILLSCVNRIIGIYGYNTELGIKHCSRNNRFNLSCDIMEPFRPFVDLIVYRNKERELDWEYKKELISLPYTPVAYMGRRTSLYNALEDYAVCAFKSLEDNDDRISEVKLKNMDYIERNK